MKKLILMAISMFLASSVFAQWNTNVWPATNLLRFASTNDYIRITNDTVVADSVLTFTVSSSNEIPNYSTNGYIYTSSDTNAILYTLNGTNIYGSAWDARSWDTAGLGIPIRARRWGRILSSVAPIMRVPADTDPNTFSVTNTFYSFIMLDEWGANDDKLGDFTQGAYTNSYSTVSGGTTQDFTEILTWFTTNITDTGTIPLNAKDVRAYDCYRAIRERINAYTNQYPAASFGSPMLEPTRLYRHERYNLNQMKAGISTMFGFSDALSGVFWMDTELKGTNTTYDEYMKPLVNKSLTYDVVGLSITQALDYVGAPSNYLSYTPYRQLNGYGYPYGRYVTNTYVLQGDTDPVTNFVYDYLGETNILTGTNGQVVTTVTTNENIYEGFTELDYGWKYMTNLIVQAKEIGWARGDEDTKFIFNGASYSPNLSPSPTSWAEAQSRVYETTNFNPAVKMYATEGFYDSISATWSAFAYQFEVTNILSGVETESGLGKRVHFYAQGDVGRPVVYAEAVFDNNGFTIYSNITQFIDVSPITTNESLFISTNIIGTTNGPPAWATDPSVYGAGGPLTYRGFGQSIGDNEGYRIIEWNWDYK